MRDIDEQIDGENYKDIISINCSLKDAGKRIDVVINEYMSEVTRAYIQNLIDGNNVEIKGKNKVKSGNKIKGTEEITVKIPEDVMLDIVPENIPINIIYQDKDMVVINKESNMVVHPAVGNYTGTLVHAVLYHVKDLSSMNGVVRPGIVHRLDKDTSGVIVIAKNDIAHLKLSEMFKEKTMEKTYICICKGNFKEHKGRIENLIGRDKKDRKKMAIVEEGGRVAISNYEVIDSANNFSLVKVKIETGRTHQIRVHMRGINHPIVGDSVYGITGSKEMAKRQMLHAYTLKFNHPITGEQLFFQGEIPEDFKIMAKRLKLNLERLNPDFKEEWDEIKYED
ncbi:MAG: RluA family pseudouridine synthase [Fusobacteriaceae bacterium]